MVLIDTHVVVWMSQEGVSLSNAAALAIARSRQEGGVAISDITFREIALLVAKGRITIDKPINVYLQFLESIFVVLPINEAVANRSIRFRHTYPNDPADQIIGATAIVHELPLVTQDEAIRDSGEVNCVW